MKLVWISGASSGIGRALVATAPWSDVRILNLSRRPVSGCEHIAADLATADGWDRAARSFAQELRSFDSDLVGFVHCAGTIQPIGFADEVDQRAYRRAVLLNSVAPQVLGQAFLSAVRGLDVESHLVMLTSGAARTPYEGWSSYCAGKAAVDAWVRTAGREAERSGSRCRVIAVSPGPTATAMQEQIRATPRDRFPHVGRFRALYEQGGLAEPADVAGRLWALLSERLDNGAVLDLRA